MADLETQVVELQIRIAWQDDTIARLNDVVTSQQNQIDQLLRALDTLERLVRENTPAAASPADVEEPPPHY